MATTKPTDKPEVKREKITLEFPHRHGGEDYPAGATIEVDADQAKRIREAAAKRKAEEKSKAN